MNENLFFATNVKKRVIMNMNAEVTKGTRRLPKTTITAKIQRWIPIGG